LKADFYSDDSTECANVDQCINFFDFSYCNPTSWQWSFPGAIPSQSSEQNPKKICYNLPGSYSVTLIVSNSTSSDTLTVNNMVKVGGLQPVIKIIGGDTLVSSYGFSYQWYFNGLAIDSATDSFYVATKAGLYSVYVVDSLGCTATSNYINTSIRNLSNSEIKIFPNPSTEEFSIRNLQFSLKAKITIYNSLQDKVYEAVLKDKSVGDYRVSTEDFKKGFYFVEISIDNNTLMKKLVVE